MSIAEALDAAVAAKLDLVEIAPDADPIVCKIMDYGKHIFEAKKAQGCGKEEAEAAPK